MLLSEANPVFRYVYHITNKNNIPSIRQQGLIAVDRSPGKQWEHIRYKKPSIFVITRNSPDVVDEIVAMMVSKEFSMDDMDNNADVDVLTKQLVILTIDLAKCQDVDLSPDPSASPWNHSKILYGTVPPEAIVKINQV